MNVYGKLNSSTQSVQKNPPEKGWIKVFENKQRPTPEHILNSDGVWFLPSETKEAVANKRKLRYQQETDEERNHILTDELLDPNVAGLAERKVAWRDKVLKIKAALPFPAAAKVQSYYNAVKEPTL